MVAVTAITYGAAVNPPTAAGDPPAVQPTTTLVNLSAQSTPLALPVDAPALLTDWIQRVIVPPSLGAPVPTPQFPPIVAPTSIGTSIKGIYNAVEPWVQYGFDLAAYAVGWVPYVGWLAPQITIFYHFGERIARSITFNFADWLDGRISFGQGLVNIGVDTLNSFVQLGIDQWNFWLPSLPPLPPFPFAATPPESTAIEPLTTAIDSLAVTASSEEGAGPKPKTNGESWRRGTTTDESRTTSEIATVKPPRGERADQGNREPAGEAGAADGSVNADSVKHDGRKPNAPKTDAPKVNGPNVNGPKSGAPKGGNHSNK